MHISEGQWTVLELMVTMRQSWDDRHRSPKHSPGQPVWTKYVCLESQVVFDVSSQTDGTCQLYADTDADVYGSIPLTVPSGMNVQRNG